MLYLHKNRLFVYTEKRKVEHMKSFLINAQGENQFESYSIPPPVSQLTHLYHSFLHVHHVASVRGGAIAGMSVTILFGLAVLMLFLATILSLYLIFILYNQRQHKVKSEKRRKHS